MSESKNIYLPLEKLDKCGVCGKKTDLRLCSSCGERIYCSAECQKGDWSTHKLDCGKTDRIELKAFYPFLAYLAEISRINPEIPLHPALCHEVLSDPNPHTPATNFPDGTAAKLIIMGPPTVMKDLDSERWWASAASQKVRSKLLRRIGREGNVLPILTAVCISLLEKIYTTTSSKSPDGKVNRRVRMRWNSSPIADFGIAAGSADVKDQDTFAYFNTNDGTFTKGQDPKKHYWLYFTTLRGEEIVLDCSMFTFNMCMLVQAKPYLSSLPGPQMEFIPAFVRDREISEKSPAIHTERKRVSALRSPDLAKVVINMASRDALTHVTAFMEGLSGQKPTEREIDLVAKFTATNCELIRNNLSTQAWKNYPASPSLAVETDPGEMDDQPPEGETDWPSYMKKFNRNNKGKVSKGALGEAFSAWEKKKNS